MNKFDPNLQSVSVTRLALSLMLAFLLAFLILSPGQETKTKSSNDAWKKVKVFFHNSRLDSGQYDCTAVHPVTRWVDSTAYPPMAALRELLKGPTDEEKAKGYGTVINSGVGIKGLWIENGLAKVDFTGRMGEGGGSCWVGGNFHQVKSTLEQFDSVDEIKFMVSGSIWGLQP